METDFRYILQPVEAAQEGFLLHVCLSFHCHTLLVRNNSTESVGSEARCKSNWFHWKADKWQWLVAGGFLPSLTRSWVNHGPSEAGSFPSLHWPPATGGSDFTARPAGVQLQGEEERLRDHGNADEFIPCS